MSENQEAETKNRKWVVTPELLPIVEDFYFLYKYLSEDLKRKKNILIEGPTGAGKSLFLDIYKDFYKQQHPEAKIHTENCAHFGGKNSDANIARAELFGMTKDFANSLSKGNKVFKEVPGLIGATDNGLLVLEEIGDIPSEVEAMLLTFIETGEYRQAGSTKILKANTQIIGSTNKPHELREDFLHRFIRFKVPGLHSRRRDILYIIAEKAPEIIRQLRSFEILALLSYNWPGNVRELETIIDIINWQSVYDVMFKKSRQKQYKDTNNIVYSSLFKLDAAGAGNFYSFFNFDEYTKNIIQGNLSSFIKKEQKIKNYGLSFNYSKIKRPLKRFENLSFSDYEEFSNFPQYRFIDEVPIFERTYKGFEKLFENDVDANSSLLDKPKTCSISASKSSKDTSNHSNLLPESIFSFPKKKLLIAYYKGLLQRSGNNISKAAGRARVSESAFREFCNRHKKELSKL